MATDASTPLFDINDDVQQKEVKQEPANPLYDFMQNEQNGNGEDFLTNGDSGNNGVEQGDLLGGGDNSNDLFGGGNSVDLFGDSSNVEVNTKVDVGQQGESNVDLLGDSGEVTEQSIEEEKPVEVVADTGDLLGDSGDLLGDSGPVTSDDSGVTVDSNVVEENESREETQETEETEEDEEEQVTISLCYVIC